MVNRYLGGRVTFDGPGHVPAATADLDRAYAHAPPQVRQAAFDDLFAALRRNTLAGVAKEVVVAHLRNNVEDRLAALTARPATHDPSYAEALRVLAGHMDSPPAAAAEPAPRAAVRATNPLRAANQLVPLTRAKASTRPTARRATQPNPAVAQRPTADALPPRPAAKPPVEVAAEILRATAKGLRHEDLVAALVQVGSPAFGDSHRTRGYQALLGGLAAGQLHPHDQAQVGHFLAHQASVQLILMRKAYNRFQGSAANEAKERAHLLADLERMVAAKVLSMDDREYAHAFASFVRSSAAAPQAAVRPPHNAEVQRIVAELGAQEGPIFRVNKVPLQALEVLGEHNNLERVHLSALTHAHNNQVQAFVATTSARGGFAKFRLAVLPETGQVMGARMVRTVAQAPKRPEHRPTHRTRAHLYIDERNALSAVQSPFAPTKTLVDDKGRVYDLVKLADGDLHDLRHQLTPQDRAAAVPVALQDILQDLVKLEDVGMLHHDIKPSNLVWQRDGTFALADYGFAHPDTDNLYGRGTPEYLPPEAMDRQTQLGRGHYDVYAVGLSMVEMLHPKGSLQTFPLSMNRPNEARMAAMDSGYWQEMTAQAANVRQVYGEWAAHHAANGRNPATLSAAAQEVEASYQRMARIHPNLAEIVYLRMLNPNDALRTSSKQLLDLLQNAVPPELLGRTAVAPALVDVVETAPAQKSRTRLVEALQQQRLDYLAKARR